MYNLGHRHSSASKRVHKSFKDEQLHKRTACLSPTLQRSSGSIRGYVTGTQLAAPTLSDAFCCSRNVKKAEETDLPSPFDLLVQTWVSAIVTREQKMKCVALSELGGSEECWGQGACELNQGSRWDTAVTFLIKVLNLNAPAQTILPDGADLGIGKDKISRVLNRVHSAVSNQGDQKSK